MLRDEPAQHRAVHAADNDRADLLRLPIAHAGHGDLVRHRSAAGEFPAPLVAHVLDLAADERLVGFDGAEEHAGAVAVPHLAEPVSQVPGGLLRDTEVAVKLHA